MKQSYVYMMSNRFRGTVYIGVTSNLIKRAYEHKTDLIKGFTREHGLHTLVYYEIHSDMREAIQRESQMKAWKRAWKIELIEKVNPFRNDLYASIL